MLNIVSFLSDLIANNNREWFNANKDRYLDVKKRVDEITLKLIDQWTLIEPETASLRPSDCLWRIYRDTRFSPDKTPYKNHIGIYISPFGGKKSEYAGYYLHLQPGHCLIAGGAWCPPAPLLKEFRKAIYDNIEEYLEIINNPTFKKCFPIIGDNPLKSAPKGFPKDWEYIDLLKPRDFTVFHPISEKFLADSKAIEKVIDYFKIVKPYNDFLNYTFEEHPELAHIPRC